MLSEMAELKEEMQRVREALNTATVETKNLITELKKFNEILQKYTTELGNVLETISNIKERKL